MKSFPQNSVNHDRLYSAEDFRDYFTSFISNGVFVNPANSCMAMAVKDSTIVIKPGKCFINGCVGISDGTEVINISEGDGLYNRYDLIVLRLDLDTRDIHAEVIEGVPAANPVYPEMTRTSLKYDLAIAAVLVTPNSYEITQADITDLRQDTQYCGIVTGIIRLTDTTDLFAQYNQALNDFIAQLGEDDRVTIITEDPIARRLARENRGLILSGISVL